MNHPFGPLTSRTRKRSDGLAGLPNMNHADHQEVPPMNAKFLKWGVYGGLAGGVVFGTIMGVTGMG